MNLRYFSISFLFCFRRLPPRRFLAQELENVRLLPMHWLINLFEFSNQSKNSNLFAGFFLLKYRCKWIYLILSVNTQNWFIVWFNQWCQKFSNIFFEFLFWLLTREINLVNIYRLLFKSNLLSDMKSRTLILCFDR